MFRISNLVAAALVAVAASSAQAQSPGNAAPRETERPSGSLQDRMGSGSMIGMRGTMGGHETDASAGIVGIELSLEADKIGAPGRLVVHGVEPQSPAYYAGIMRGDRIVAVDGQTVEGKSMDDAAKAIRGDVGTTVKLGLDRQGQARDVSLTRVEPLRRMGGRGSLRGMGNMGGSHRMMDMMRMHHDMMGTGAESHPNASRPQ